MDYKDRQIVVLRDVLQNIVDIGSDYDGYENSLEGCKNLIDEFVETCYNALNKKGISYLTNGKIVNVFNEVIGEYNPTTWELNYYDKDRRDY